jgi:hypothetical protein
MYETPKLNRVGKSDGIVLGITSWGTDIDGYVVIDEMEFAEDPDTVDGLQPSRK